MRIIISDKQRLFASVLIVVVAIAIVSACGPDAKNTYTVLKGNSGTPRFNLQFTNEDGSDVDLYVETPDGSVINYQDPAAQKGKMDIDCLCGDCPEGGNENIYWEPGTAPKGTYKIWVHYFDPCVGNNGVAGYRLRIMDGKMVIKTYEGKLSTVDRKSPVYTFIY